MRTDTEGLTTRVVNILMDAKAGEIIACHVSSASRAKSAISTITRLAEQQGFPVINYDGKYTLTFVTGVKLVLVTTKLLGNLRPDYEIGGYL